jgi:hypothetical protein
MMGATKIKSFGIVQCYARARYKLWVHESIYVNMEDPGIFIAITSALRSNIGVAPVARGGGIEGLQASRGGVTEGLRVSDGVSIPNP